MDIILIYLMQKKSTEERAKSNQDLRQNFTPKPSEIFLGDIISKN